VKMAEADPIVAQRAKEELETIRRNVAIQIRLIDDLVDVARIATGKLKFLVTRVDLHEPLKAAIRSCQDGLEDNQLKLRTDLSATESSVYGDAARLQQVFWNLLRNAIKFTPQGGCITVRSANDVPGWIAVDIADSGIGIEQTRLSTIFKAFEQGDHSATSTFGGLGLGLSICGALTDAHGGTVTAASDGIGRGAKFTVRLPLRPATGSVALLHEQGEPNRREQTVHRM
jgi:signal transduction histidine kinase